VADYIRYDIKNDMLVVGEYWLSDVSLLHKYLKACEFRMSLFDALLRKQYAYGLQRD
jgi:hypothetical protein